jgi:hypothetical protein
MACIMRLLMWARVVGPIVRPRVVVAMMLIAAVWCRVSGVTVWCRMLRLTMWSRVSGMTVWARILRILELTACSRVRRLSVPRCMVWSCVVGLPVGPRDIIIFMWATCVAVRVAVLQVLMLEGLRVRVGAGFRAWHVLITMPLIMSSVFTFAVVAVLPAKPHDIIAFLGVTVQDMPHVVTTVTASHKPLAGCQHAAHHYMQGDRIPRQHSQALLRQGSLIGSV